MQRRARSRAAELGISFAEYVRRLIARDLGDRMPPVSPSEVFDLGSFPGSDIARDKDEAIGEAAAAGRRMRGTK